MVFVVSFFLFVVLCLFSPGKLFPFGKDCKDNTTKGHDPAGNIEYDPPLATAGLKQETINIQHIDLFLGNTEIF